MVISRIAASKNHIELLGSPVRSETGFVILGKFWSRYDLQNFENRFFFWGDDQGELSKGAVPLICEKIFFRHSPFRAVQQDVRSYGGRSTV
jgi:hypothetical protein